MEPIALHGILMGENGGVLRDERTSKRNVGIWLGTPTNIPWTPPPRAPAPRHRAIGARPLASLASAALAAGLVGSLALLPVAWAQGSATRRRVPRLPAAKPPHQGWVPGEGTPIRVLAIGESTICGIGLARGDETVTAATAQALARSTGRPVAWRAHGLSGATAREGLERLLPRIAPDADGPSHRCVLRQRRDRLSIAGGLCR